MNEFSPGERYGDRTVLHSRTVRRARGDIVRMVRMRCKCGHVSDVNAADIRRGAAKRCSSCAAYARWGREPEKESLSDGAQRVFNLLVSLIERGTPFNDVQNAFGRLIEEREKP